MMTVEQAKEKYEKRFGGFPEFLFMGAAPNVIIEAVEKALLAGEEIEAPDPDGDY